MNQTGNLPPSIELISGAYSSILWNEVEGLCNEQTPEFIYNALNALYDCGKYDEAYQLVQVIYDMVGLEIPDDVIRACEIPETRKSYIAELIMDINDMLV